MDNGHYHPTEVVSDKISSMLLFNDKIALHVTRPVRWDSDHVVLFDDETREIAKEIVRNDAIDRVLLALDFFDASINRISAWVNGMRNLQKALLYALLDVYKRQGKTVVGQKTVWKNDDFLVNGGKPGVEDMDFFYSSFISFIVFPDVVTDNEGL